MLKQTGTHCFSSDWSGGEEVKGVAVGDGMQRLLLRVGVQH